MRTLVVSLATLIAAPALGADSGFTALFDGKTLNGWHMVNTKDNFFVRDGILVLNKGAGWLATDKTYRDFELRIRYRFVTPGTDSGVFIRAALEGKNWPAKGHQVQNMDNLTLGRIGGAKGSHNVEALKQAKKPTGEWQDLVIIAKGKTCRVALNGTEIAETEDLKFPEGHVGLQAEGGILEFERIEIKPL